MKNSRVSCPALLLLILSVNSFAQFQNNTLNPQQIPVATWRSGMGGKLRSGHQSGVVSAASATLSISILWSASALENQPPTSGLGWDLQNVARGNAKITSETQAVPTNFQPTAIGKLTDSAILVAGIKAGPTTVIQRWTFTWPGPMPQVETDPVSGLQTVLIALPSVQKVTVYSSTANPKYVTGICGLRDSSQQFALVQFFSPNDIMRLDLGTGALSLLASETNIGATFGPVQSLSAKDYAGIIVRDSSDLGYMYRFHRANLTPVSTPLLFLTDTDRNGTIDGLSEMTSATFEAQGLGIMQSYNNYWLD